jgi:hypothetical protein
MKKLLLLLLPIVLLMTACESGPIESFESVSADGTRKIVISGERSSPANPIMIKVKLIVPKGEKDFFFENYASSLTKDNAPIVWQDNEHATLTLTASDGVVQTIDIKLLDDEVHAIKRMTH